MRRRVVAALFALSILLWTWLAQAGSLAPALEAQLLGLPPGGTLPVIVEMRDQADPAAAVATVAPGVSKARGHAVVAALQAMSARTQGPIRAFLAQEQAIGTVQRITPLWVFNGLAVTAAEPVIRRLAARPDVREVRPDAPIPLPPPPLVSGAVPFVGLSEWNIQQIRAPETWALNPLYDGTGAVVGSFDTGVDGTHPDLASRYRGNDAISWYDPYGQHASPTDFDVHGTHTTGTAVGGDAGGTHIGVAPGAKWIAAKGWDDSGVASTSAFHQIFQWFLAPGGDPANAPDVVNNSWGVANSGCVKEFLPDVKAWRAAGIFPSFAAGNNGPFARSVRSPGNYPEAFAVGATDMFDTIASFSGRGPSPCDRSIKPDVSAPGDGITSAVPGGYYDTFSGTSMATPHLTGAVAVLRSIDPALTVDQLESALMQGAVDLGSAGPDNSYGSGRLDLFMSAQFVMGGPDRPVVTIAATTPTASEAGSIPGIFTVTRTGPTSSALTVHYSAAGTATPGSDYTSLSGSVTIPAGSATATIAVVPVDDALIEADETVIVTLAVDAAYIVGKPGSATVTVASDDANPVPGLTSLAPSSALAGDGALTLTIYGGGFIPSSVARWNGSSRATTFVSDSQLQAAIAQGDLATAGTVQVTVVNPAPGGGTSNALTFTIDAVLPGHETLTVSPTTAAAGGTVTATWSGIAGPTPTDWIALYVPGAPDGSYVSYRYTTGTTRGSVPFTLPATLAAGTYELRLFPNNTLTRLATSNPFTVPQPVTLTVSPTTVAAGGTLTATWSGIPAPSATDWLGLYQPGAADTATLASQNTTGAASGSLPFPLPGTLTPGTYELRLFAGGGARLAVSNAFTVQTAGPVTLSVSPTTIGQGGTLTATWSGIATPTTTDWLGLYAIGAPDGSYISYRYTTGAASGSVPFPVPGTLALGTYELRLFSNSTLTRLATSNAFTVSQAASLTVSPTTIAQGGTVTATWSGIATPSATDWLGLYQPGAADTATLASQNTTGAASGSLPFPLSGTLTPGTYELRLFSSGSFTRLATSNPFTVQAAGPVTLSVSPTTIAAGGTLTATWSGIATPTTADWLGLYAIGAPDGGYISYRYTTGAASGSVPFPVPGTLAPGTYELRLFSNGSLTRLATSNALTVSQTVSLSASPTTVAAGGTVTAAWAGIATPTPTDWLGLYQPGAADTATLASRNTTGASSGSVPFTLPGTLAPGTYELRLFANGTFTRLAISNAFTVEPSAESVTLTASPTTVAAGGTVTATWSGIATPTTTDWLGLYAIGAPDGGYISYRYTTGAAGGSVPFALPGTVAPGTYELRLFSNNSLTRLATSNAFTVPPP
ncbi:MAG TPA: S8 family serine peptidase [Methylomirabilota bacterium]|nr:S8 family serine peptidase [Methylomirabilota bacterium]